MRLEYSLKKMVTLLRCFVNGRGFHLILLQIYFCLVSLFVVQQWVTYLKYVIKFNNSFYNNSHDYFIELNIAQEIRHRQLRSMDNLQRKLWKILQFLVGEYYRCKHTYRTRSFGEQWIKATRRLAGGGWPETKATADRVGESRLTQVYDRRCGRDHIGNSNDQASNNRVFWTYRVHAVSYDKPSKYKINLISF